jgi:phosphatidylglycerol lysyltransferase
MEAREVVARRVVIRFVAAVTFLAGAVNLASVMVPALPERLQQLEAFVSPGVHHVTRFATLVLGFALTVTSVNILRRKRRAAQLVLALAAASAVLHIVKGLDYAEAAFSGIVFLLLIVTRRSFTVRSNVPDLRAGLALTAVALIVTFAYGVAGFWLLDRREFGVNFHWEDATRESLRYLTFVRDPDLVPRTRHAHWFLDSLSLISICGVGYALFELYSPVHFRFRVQPRAREHARHILEAHGRSALDYFKLWPDKTYFFSASQQSFLAYRVGAHVAVALSDPVGPETEIVTIVSAFRAFCRKNDWRVAFYQALPDFLPIYAELGFHRLKIGEDAIVDLKQFTLQGADAKELRHTVNRTEKIGLGVRRWDPPIPPEVLQELRAVSDEWLQIPGRRERQFTLGVFEPEYVRSTPVFAVTGAGGHMHAFVNIIPSFRRGEATSDLMRRRNDAPSGVMDYLFVKLFLWFQEQGYERFNLGMAPMSGFQENEEATLEEKAIHYFFQRLNFVFSFRGLHQYKAKFAHQWEPRYVVYEGPLDLPRVGLALGAVSRV